MYYLKAVKMPVFFIFCILLISFANAQSDTCGMEIIDSALKTSWIRSTEHKRVNSFREWLFQNEKPCSSIVSGINERIAFLSDTTTYSIDTAGLSFSGNPSSPVQIVIYVSMTCPLCKRLYSELYDSVTSGSLSGRVKLAVKLFGLNELNRALAAAFYMGKQPELIRAVSAVKERLTMEMVFRAADSVKIPVDSLKARMEKPGTLIYLKKSHEEAEKNGVTVTPTLFMNFRRYRSYKDCRWVADAAGMLYERMINDKK